MRVFLFVCFHIPHISEIIWYLNFYVWFISLSMMLARSVHVTNGRIFSFLGLNNISVWVCGGLGGCITTSLSICPFDGHLGCFRILVIINNAAMNIEVQISFWVRVFLSFEYILRSGIAGSYGSPSSNFWTSSVLFSIEATPVYHPGKSVIGFPFLYNLTSISCVVFLMVAILTGARW